MNAFIVAACRSPVAPRGGGLSHLDLHDLGAPVVRAALAQAGIAPEAVDELIVSNALGAGGNPARRVALAAGLPQRIAGLSTDRQCAGGLDALLLARQMILSGDAEVVVAGGVESYSRRPQRLHRPLDGSAPVPYDQAPFTPWPDRDPDMTQAAADLAQTCGISPAAMDRWAVDSHAKARSATICATEIVPVAGLRQDSFTRRLTDRLCARATPLVGDITAANAAVAADGAAFCVVVSQAVAKGCAQPVHLMGGSTLGGDPICPGLAPVAAIKAALSRHALPADTLSAIEIMEAYAVQAIACQQRAGLDAALVNAGGGALARGHPIGASGAINAVRLYHQLVQRGSGTGLAAIAAAGGIGSALLLAA